VGDGNVSPANGVTVGGFTARCGWRGHVAP
jgi:hypothetical protein